MPSAPVQTWWRRGTKLARIGSAVSIGGLGVAGAPATYTAAAPAAADSFVTDVTKPSASNTGPAAGGFSPTIAINGDVTLSAGQVLENRVINGYVTMGSGSVLRGCIIQGRNYGTYAHGGSFLSVAAGLASAPLVEFCNIGSTQPHHYAMNCLNTAGDIVIRRCDIHDGADFMKASGTQTNSEYAGNYFHDFSYHNDDADQSSNTQAPYVSHNDCIQVHNGLIGSYFHGNFVDMRPSQTTSVGQPASNVSVGWGSVFTIDGGFTSNINWRKNWTRGGAVGLLQANQASQATTQGSTSFGYVGDNLVAWDQYDYGSGSKYQMRYLTAYADIGGQYTNKFDPDDPAAIAAGIAGNAFVLGTSGKSGIRRP